MSPEPSNKEAPSFDLSLWVGGVHLKTIMKELEEWLEDRLQSIEQGKAEVFHREGDFKLLASPGHFDIRVEISGLNLGAEEIKYE